MAEARVAFDIIARDKASQAFRTAGDSADGLKSRIGGLAKFAAGAFAGMGVATLTKGFVDAARESDKVAAQTAAVLKSTGGAAGLTAKQFEQLAGSISAKTGVDDEAIQSAQNLLATFTNVQNRVGKGNDIFSQSTEVLVDMAAALKTDVSSGAIQLGKALNDPIKGITALSRVGVTFTDQQRNQIRTMQEAGDVAGAQRVILAELRKEFGGSAEAIATPWDRLKVSLGNVQEQIGGALVPVIDRLASWLAERLPGALASLQRIWNVTIGSIVAAWNEGVTSDGWVGTFERVGVAVRQIWDQVRMFFNTLRTGFTEDEGTPVERFALVLRNVVLPAVARVAAVLRDHLRPALLGAATAVAAFKVTQAVQGLWGMVSAAKAFVALQGGMRAAWIAAGGPAILVAAGIAAVAAAVVIAYQRFEGFRNAVNAVARFLTGTVAPAIASFTEGASEQFRSVVEYVRRIWPQISEAVLHVVNVIRDAVRTGLAVASALWRQFGDDVLRYVRVAFETVRGVVQGVVTIIQGIVQTVLAIINGDWGRAWSGLKTVVEGAVRAVGAVLGGIPRLIGVTALAVFDAAKSLGKAILDGIGAGLTAAGGFVGNLAAAIGTALKNVVNTVVIRPINAGIRALAQVFADVNIPIVGRGFDLAADLIKKAQIPTLHTGGVVPGRPGTDVLALLEAGEFVLPRSSVGNISGAIPTSEAAGNWNFQPGAIVVNGASEKTGVRLAAELRSLAWRMSGAW